MSRKIQLKRGLKAGLPTLDAAEIGFTTDTKEVFIGTGAGNVQIKTVDALQVALSDETTALTVGTGKFSFRVPYACKFYKIPRISLGTASTSGVVTVDINKNGTSIFSTLLTIDINEKTSVTAAVPCVLTKSPTTFADDDEVTFDIDVAGTGAKGLKATLYFEQV